MTGTRESIEEYLRSDHGVMRASLAFIMSKTIIVQNYHDYPAYATPDKKMITRMLYLPPDKNRLHDEQSAPSFKESTAEYKIDNRSVYAIFD